TSWADGQQPANLIHASLLNDHAAAINAVQSYLLSSPGASPTPSFLPYMVGPFPKDDSGIFTEVFAGLLTGGIPRAPYISLKTASNAWHLPSSIAACKENPPTTMQAQVNATPSGGVCYLTPGYIYRESVTVNAPITIIARGLSSLRGTDDWTTGGAIGNTWTSSAGTWTSSTAIPAMALDGLQAGDPDPYSQQHRESVFVDGLPLQLVNATPVGQQWQLDGSRHVVLGFNPSGHKIEVTTRMSVITLSANNDFILDGLDIRQVATSGDTGPKSINSSGISSAKYWILNCMIGWCHGMGLDAGGMSQMLLENNIFHGCGVSAVIGSNDTNPRIRRNIFFNNGLPLY
ncbi:MAG: right-handed parallel beta-helix repeat-containing protein, partial [Mycobacterium sp.]|nr:right-handed parallel beta-helix repeat-containing protein [Mycobacterium sp.]